MNKKPPRIPWSAWFQNPISNTKHATSHYGLDEKQKDDPKTIAMKHLTRMMDHKVQQVKIAIRMKRIEARRLQHE
jgi:hypothetical protein